MTIRNEGGITVITADEGKVLKSKSEGIISKEFWLSYIDSPENYIEIDPPPVEVDEPVFPFEV